MEKTKFRKEQCNWCGKEYDSQEEVCPFCEHGKDKINPKRFGNRFLVTPIWKQILLFLIGCFGFQLIALLVMLYIQIVNASLYPTPDQMSEFLATAKISGVINITSYLVLFAILCITLWKDNIKIFKSFADWKIFVGAVIGCVAIYIFNMAYNIFLYICGVDIASNDNQSGLEKIIEIYPLLSIIVFGIIGPFCEEVTYRVGLYTFGRRLNKIASYVITIIVFTFIHFDYGSADMINELLNIPFYAFAAFTFTFLYEKLGFGASFLSHSINNLISVISVALQNQILK